MKHNLHSITRAVIVLATSASSAHATNGYFDYGYGTAAKGSGGAAVAFPQDALAAASNPAGLTGLADRVDTGLAVFLPDRSADIGPSHFDGNHADRFLIPDFALKRSLSPDLSWGFAVYGNGGMNTDYIVNPGFGSGHAGVDLSQLFVAPTLAWKSGVHSAGVSPVFAYQRFRAYGLQGFGITDEDYDNSYGGGVRIGYSLRATEDLTFGASYQSRILTTRFTRYDHLFAGHGNFDIPQNITVGLAWKPTDELTVALDVERIFYSSVDSVGNPLTAARLANGLGSNDGPGFGWKDVTVIKTGIAYQAGRHLTLRTGYNYGTQPVPAGQTYFNILAPGVVQHHLTAGATYQINTDVAVGAFYAHAFRQTVNGDGSAFAPANLSMSQDSFGLSVSWTL